MWKVHTEPRQSSTHPRPQKTCSLSGILGHTCNIQKSFKRWVIWCDNSSYWWGKQTNQRQTLPGDTEGIGTAGWGCPQKGSCAMLTLGWNWELKLQGLCVCEVWGVGCGLPPFTHTMRLGMCFLPGGWDFVAHQADGAYETSHHKHRHRGSPDRHGHALLSPLGGGVLASLWSDLQNFPFALPAISTVKCWVVGPPIEPENLVLRPSDIQKNLSTLIFVSVGSTGC